MSAATWTWTWPGPTTLADDGFDALAQPVFVIGGVFVLVAGQRVRTGLVVAAGQQVAAVVDDGDAVGGKPGDGGGDQMLDGLHLATVQRPRGLEHHRGARAAGRRGEKICRSGMTRCTRATVDAVDGLDRARQFAFQRALAD